MILNCKIYYKKVQLFCLNVYVENFKFGRDRAPRAETHIR